jgi:NAD-dependent histone deacetylase SIR2
MTTTSFSSPVLVQEKAAPPIIDLTADPVQQTANTRKQRTVSAPQKVDEEPEDNWDSASMYEEILNEEEAYEYAGGMFYAPPRSLQQLTSIRSR